MDLTSDVIILLIVIGLALVVIAAVVSGSRSLRSRTSVPLRRQPYMTGEFSSQMELDLRLPYGRFKQLYPETTITYEEYKKLQMQRAFRRSMSSSENKRMVR